MSVHRRMLKRTAVSFCNFPPSNMSKYDCALRRKKKCDVRNSRKTETVQARIKEPDPPVSKETPNYEEVQIEVGEKSIEENSSEEGVTSDYEYFIDLNRKLYKYVESSVRANVKRYIDIGVQVETDLYADNFKDIGFEVKTGDLVTNFTDFLRSDADLSAATGN